MLPKTITIGPLTYQVKYVKKLQNADKDPLNGQICLGEGVIKIDPSAHEDHQRSTLMHEILHGVFYMAGIGAEPDHQVLDEELITRIAPILMDTLMRNPGIVSDPFINHDSRSVKGGDA